MYGKYLLEKKTRQRQLRHERAKEAEALGVDVATTRQTPKTLDNTREMEPTIVRPGDGEVMGDEAGDEFAEYFDDSVRPKIIVTTRPKPSSKLFFFIGDLMRFIPQLYYYPRKNFSVKQVCDFAQGKGFTHLMVLSEKSKVCNGMIISHLRSSTGAAAGGNDDEINGSIDVIDDEMDDTNDTVDIDADDDGDTVENDDENEKDYDMQYHCGGPTVFFKVSNVISSNDVPYHGSATSHVPELVLNGFGTRLGHRVGRFLGSIFPHNAQFQGRQVATFHNQRDYIFVRHHRYVFEEGNEKAVEKKTKVRLQELGPRFTLKLKWIQEGMFDTQFGEYEWFHKRKEMDVTRRKFHL